MSRPAGVDEVYFINFYLAFFPEKEVRLNQVALKKDPNINRL